MCPARTASFLHASYPPSANRRTRRVGSILALLRLPTILEAIREPPPGTPERLVTERKLRERNWALPECYCATQLSFMLDQMVDAAACAPREEGTKSVAMYCA